MADSASASSSNCSDLKALLIKEAVYQKNANIFFRTTVQKATASEQKHLDLTKRKLQKLGDS